jgi:hypothetical protein
MSSKETILIHTTNAVTQTHTHKPDTHTRACAQTQTHVHPLTHRLIYQEPSHCCCYSFSYRQWAISLSLHTSRSVHSLFLSQSLSLNLSFSQS